MCVIIKTKLITLIHFDFKIIVSEPKTNIINKYAYLPIGLNSQKILNSCIYFCQKNSS